MPTEPQEEVPPDNPGQPSEPPAENPANPQPEAPPPDEPGAPAPPQELPGQGPEELPLRGPSGPRTPNPATDAGRRYRYNG